MNKTKKTYILGKALIIMVFLWYFIIIPFIAFFNFNYIAIYLFAVPIIIGIVLYTWNVPKHYKGKFYEHPIVTKLQKSRSRRFIYCKAKYRFSSAHAIIEMILKNHNVVVHQDDLIKEFGYKKIGMIPTELEDALNDLFFRKALNLHATTQYFTTYAQLFNAIQQDKIVIVLYFNHCIEEECSSQAQYPRYALVNNINMSSEERKNRVILTSPYYYGRENKYFVQGKYEGEIIVPFEEFQEGFYPEDRFINHTEFKKTKTENNWIDISHNFSNFLFKFGLYTAYSTRILKPGLAIIITPVKK